MIFGFNRFIMCCRYYFTFKFCFQVSSRYLWERIFFINKISILLIYCPCITLLSYFFFKDSPNLSYVHCMPSPFVSLFSFVWLNFSVTCSSTLIIIFVLVWLLSWILIIQFRFLHYYYYYYYYYEILLYLLLTLNVIPVLPLDALQCPDAISRNIGVFKGKYVLRYDLLIKYLC